jgi:ectoine hydroxylase-related dioxygenase (phytanoyl-CoA dioxygenase family)
MIALTQAHIDGFDRDGFVVVDDVLAHAEIDAARARFEPLFSGKFETGLYPDEWNWRAGRDPDDLTRQICNGWKSDRTVAAIVLAADVGRACAGLRRWPGARLGQDNVIWKPPGTKPLGFHQDDSYNGWIVPGEMCTCWIALDDTKADRGTIEYVRGSHKWPVSPPIRQFHTPDDPLCDLRPAAAAAGIADCEIVPIEVAAGSCVIHHGRTWHGSRDNRGAAPRRSVIAHCISSAATFHPERISYIYSRCKKVGSLAMDESFFPVLWRNDGYRTPWLDDYIAGSRAA